MNERVRREDASDKLDGRARTAHESTACALRAGLGSLHIIRKEGGTNSQRTQLTQSYAFGPNQLTGTLEGSHATRIRLAQKSLSITVSLNLSYSSPNIVDVRLTGFIIQGD